MGGAVKTKIFKFDTHHHHYNNTKTQEQDGNITINPNITNKKQPNDKNIGEYVDYEEVK